MTRKARLPLARRRFLRGSLALAGLGVLSGCNPQLMGQRAPVAEGAAPAPGPQHQAFLRALSDLGYVEGQNIVIEYRWAEEQPARPPGLASELAMLNIDVILAGSGDSAVAAKGATSSIPIVFAAASDPSRPG